MKTPLDDMIDIAEQMKECTSFDNDDHLGQCLKHTATMLQEALGTIYTLTAFMARDMENGMLNELVTELTNAVAMTTAGMETKAMHASDTVKAMRASADEVKH